MNWSLAADAHLWEMGRIVPPLRVHGTLDANTAVAQSIAASLATNVRLMALPASESDVIVLHPDI